MFQVVKVADFGVARVRAQSGVMTAETGTYRWMAPEVWFFFLSFLPNLQRCEYTSMFEQFSGCRLVMICSSNMWFLYIYFDYLPCFSS